VRETPGSPYISAWTLAEALGVLSRQVKRRSEVRELVEEWLESFGIPTSHLSDEKLTSKYIDLRLVKGSINVCDDPIIVDTLAVSSHGVRTFWAIRDAAELAARLGLSAADAMHLAYVWRLCPGPFITLDSDFTCIAEQARSLGIEVRGPPCKRDP
jgi:predicted nucleic acid-binding protein